ncbi:MAG TPA: AI-2E family transporter [Steroidobacteraceae bacterium]|nr:AI-2E family transporter [Steroidobacteraceae bacterium]
MVTERVALGCLAVGAVLAIIWLALPFSTGILLGTLMAFTLEPVYALLVRRSDRPVAASLLIIATSTAIVVGALSAFVTHFVMRTVDLANMLRAQLHTGGRVNIWVDATASWLGGFGISAKSITAQLEAAAGDIASRSASIAGTLAAGAFEILLGLFFAVLTMHLVLRDWPRMISAIAVVSPLDPKHTHELLSEFRRVGRLTVSGTVVTGLAQGLIAALGFWITGVPEPLFFGIATALASLIPGVGTLLVWVPAGLYLFAIGHPAKAIIELVWGALLVVGLSDYLIRPRLVGDEAMPALMVFIALFGGLKALGLPGLIVGPVVMALAVAVLRLYAGEQERTLHAP